MCEDDPEERCHLRCALPGFSDARWRPARRTDRAYMGRLPVLNNEKIAGLYDTGWDDPKRPPDDHQDGCPGAWYRCGFVRSLAKYERLLGDSEFSSNVLLDRCDDRLVIEATQYIEMHRLRKRQQDQKSVDG